MCGDTTLGGVDFVKRLMDYCVFEYREKYNENIENSHQALEKLRIQCERARKLLSV